MLSTPHIPQTATSKMQLLARAELVALVTTYSTRNGQVCSPMMLKCVLLVLAAAETEGPEHLFAQTISSRACCSVAAVHRCLRALTEAGLITELDPLRPRSKPGRYAVSWNEIIRHIPIIPARQKGARAA